MRIVFFGAPGVGKGTFAELLSRKENIKHINVGNILRKEIMNNTNMGKEIKEYVNRGSLVPDKYTINIVKTEIEKIEKCRNENKNNDNNIDNIIDNNTDKNSEDNINKNKNKENRKIFKCLNPSRNIYKGFLLDGFPRNINQSIELMKITKIDLFVNIDLPKHILIQKLLGRRICQICDQNFNVASIKEEQFDMPPLLPSSDCKICKGHPKLIMRNDDTEETIHHRLQSYENSYIPILDFFKKKNCVFINFQLQKGIKDFDRLYNIVKQYC